MNSNHENRENYKREKYGNIELEIKRDFYIK